MSTAPTTSTEHPPSATTADALRIAVARTSRRLRRERSSSDITDGQYAVLARLDRCGPASPTALADDQHVRPPSMTRTVAALADAGLVSRTGDPDDGRRAQVALTAAGLAHLRDTRRLRSAWLAARLADLAPDDLAVLDRAAALLTDLAER